MLPAYRFIYESESYTSVPPARYIFDSQGNVFQFGLAYQDERERPQGHYAFNVLLNEHQTGEFASQIEKKDGRVRIFTKQGWKYFNGRSFV